MGIKIKLQTLDVIKAERHSVVTTVQQSVTLYITLEFGITLSK
jgi:hypothetical protein